MTPTTPPQVQARVVRGATIRDDDGKVAYELSNEDGQVRIVKKSQQVKAIPLEVLEEAINVIKGG